MKLRSWFVYTAILALVIPLTAAADMVGEGSFDRTLKVTGRFRSTCRRDPDPSRFAKDQLAW